MAALGTTPKTWIPYMNSKDCSQGFCSLYCPQWCYIIFPPPPPFEFPDKNSSPNFSPLVIAIIGILASAFLLVSYYTLISKYCGNNDSERREDNHDEHAAFEDNQNPSNHEPWHAPTAGLDEALIKSITVCKYKKGDGLIDGTDCSICLGEFKEDESMRLLPKCSHAFHVPCIDTWLKSHSNCPLCRANIIFITASLPQLPLPEIECSGGTESLQDGQLTHENAVVTQDMQRVAAEEQILQNNTAPKSPFRTFRDPGILEQRDAIIEIRDEAHQQIRRSVSMDHSCEGCASAADVLHVNQEEVIQEDYTEEVGSSKNSTGGSKSNHRRRVLQCVFSPVALKRSFSSGRFSLTRHGRVCDTISHV